MTRIIPTVMVLLLLLSPMAIARTSQPQPASDRDAEIRGAVLAYVQQKTADLGCEISLKRFAVNGAFSLPKGPLDYEVVAPQQWEGWGNAGISIIVRQGNKVVRNLAARVEVEALAPMVVTVRQIDYGSVIAPNDLALRKQDVASVQGRYLGRIEDAAGKKARVTFRANAPVRSDQLEKVPLIKPGQLVTIVAENDHLRITVTGKAKSAGAAGDTIIVQNLDSLKQMPARVLDADTVQIVF